MSQFRSASIFASAALLLGLGTAVADAGLTRLGEAAIDRPIVVERDRATVAPLRATDEPRWQSGAQ